MNDCWITYRNINSGLMAWLLLAIDSVWFKNGLGVITDEEGREEGEEVGDGRQAR